MARYQYETSPRKVRIDYEPVKKKTTKKSNIRRINTVQNKKAKMKKVSRAKIVCFVVLAFVAFFTVSYRNAIIDAKYAKIKTLKSELAAVEKENEQLEAGIESSINLKTIQEEAETLLGMKTLSNDQISYVSLPKTDYVEASSEEVKLQEEDNFFIKIVNMIKGLIK